MNIPEIQPGIRYVGVNDRTTTRFEALWPLPAGVSYNAYLVVGERIALVDTVEERFGGRLFENIRREIGECLRERPRLQGDLYIEHGAQRYRLEFDCAHCEMKLIAAEK